MGLVRAHQAKSHKGISLVGAAFFAVEDIEVAAFSIEDVAAPDGALAAGGGTMRVHEAIEIAHRVVRIPIPDPFCHVSGHIIKAKVVGAFGAHLVYPVCSIASRSSCRSFR